MRFDELILQDPDGAFRVRFHPQLTVLAGLGPVERRSLAESVLGSLAGGTEVTVLRYLDETGEPVIVRGENGRVTAQREDGSPLPAPVGSLAPDRAALRSLMLLHADDLGVLGRPSREDEHPELREARDMLDALTAELEVALGQQEQLKARQAQLDGLEEQLRVALDGKARREYAQVLAQLERVRAEAAALKSGTAGIDADQHLLASADTARDIARRWEEAAARVRELARPLEGHNRLDPEARDRLARIPVHPPADLDELVTELQRAADARDALDQRLQTLSVAKLPAPSDPLVAELGLLDQAVLWGAVDRLAEAGETLQRVQLSLGGLELDEMGPPPAVVAEIEAAHSELNAADQAVEAARLRGYAGLGVSVVLAVLGLVTTPLVLPVALVGAVVAMIAFFARPKARRAHAARAEQAALARAEATSYLAFHIRRVEASVDPHLRAVVETTMLEHRAALESWVDLVGPDAGLEAALALRAEIEDYNEALRNLGDTADEIEQLRRELDEQAEPACRAARQQVVDLCDPYLVAAPDLEDLPGLPWAVAQQCKRGAAAREEIKLGTAEMDEQVASARLDELLLQLGFDAGPLDARVGALEWAVSRAAEREDARHRARPRAEIDAELAELQNAAAKLRRPEWATVTAADAAAPDIPELEARRSQLLSQLAEARPEVDVERLADRRAAVERRVTALEARHIGIDLNGDPGAIADIQQNLLAHLATASEAGPDGDPVPVLLDEVFLRVPADRKWDLLDLLHRLSERHQLIYLSDDAFVAAWARQRALDGAITLLELAPEPA